MTEQTCPKRMEDFGPWERKESLDNWGNDSTCSFCGSLDPSVFMKRLEDRDVELIPTDKDYKAYLRNIRGQKFKQTYRNCYEMGARDCAGPDTCTHWVTRETEQTKFYFQHLDIEQKRRLVELVNEQKIQFAYPGHFYRLPFFIRREERVSQS